jgi:hypothetical protein
VPEHPTVPELPKAEVPKHELPPKPEGHYPEPEAKP